MQPLERDLQRLHRLALSLEAAHLRSCGAATVDAIAVRPRRLAIRASRLQPEHLSVLRHLAVSSSLSIPCEQESRSRLKRRGAGAIPPAFDDPSSHTEVVVLEAQRRA